jgi:hypothetical protein
MNRIATTLLYVAVGIEAAPCRSEGHDCALIESVSSVIPVLSAEGTIQLSLPACECALGHQLGRSP